MDNVIESTRIFFPAITDPPRNWWKINGTTRIACNCFNALYFWVFLDDYFHFRYFLATVSVAQMRRFIFNEFGTTTAISGNVNCNINLVMVKTFAKNTHYHFVKLPDPKRLMWMTKIVGNLTAFRRHSEEFVSDFWLKVNTNEYGENMRLFRHCLCIRRRRILNAFISCVLVLGFVFVGFVEKLLFGLNENFDDFRFISLANGHLFAHHRERFYSIQFCVCVLLCLARSNDASPLWVASITYRNAISAIRVCTVDFRTIYTHFRHSAS